VSLGAREQTFYFTTRLTKLFPALFRKSLFDCFFQSPLPLFATVFKPLTHFRVPWQAFRSPFFFSGSLSFLSGLMTLLIMSKDLLSGRHSFFLVFDVPLTLIMHFPSTTDSLIFLPPNLTWRGHGFEDGNETPSRN